MFQFDMTAVLYATKKFKNFFAALCIEIAWEQIVHYFLLQLKFRAVIVVKQVLTYYFNLREVIFSCRIL